MALISPPAYDRIWPVEEEFADPVGQRQPRLDLVIPSLALTIETKFMYRRTSLRETIEQIAADNSLYLPRGSAYRYIIPVIRDNAARTEQHAMMTHRLKRSQGMTEVMIPSRPAGKRPP